MDIRLRKDKKVPGKRSDGQGDLYKWERERRKGEGESEAGVSLAGLRFSPEAGQVGRTSSCRGAWPFPYAPAPPGEIHGINQWQTVSLVFGVLMESSR